MKFLRALITFIFVTISSVVLAHEAAIRVIVVGEDSSPRAVPRSSEIYKQVVAELQQSLIRENIFVVDEDMISAKLGFAFQERRDKQELIQTLQLANDTTDATVKSRLGVVFAIFPNIQEMSVTRKLTVRIRGQVYDLKALRALSSFEVSSPETVTIPKSEAICNDICVAEKAGEVSRSLARELGAVLIKKLHNVVESGNYSGEMSGSASGSKAAGDSVLESVYTVKFNLMKKSDVLRATKQLESAVVREIELVKSSETQRIYSVTTNKNLGDLEESIMGVLLDLGVDIDNLHFKSFGTEISIESL